MLELLVVLSMGLLLLLPQIAGLLVVRFVPRASWTAWPAAAIAVYGVVWHQWVWAPASDRGAQAGCGMWSVGCTFILVGGLLLHLGVGALLGWYVWRARQSSRRAPPAAPPQ
ncbi:MAG TPA: hypothetical protein VKQ32_30185 [Polyangia bacterium]|nr:hypothetical protein [Polyangia bacterium]